MKRTDFKFDLPPELIAQRPVTPRSASRMLLLDAAAGQRRDLDLRDLPDLLSPADLLVFNDTRVVPARVHGLKETGGRIELLLERVLGPRTALVHARASKALKPGGVVRLPGSERARLIERSEDLFHMEFSCDVLGYFETHGEVPLPPYIGRSAEPADRERYQTVYARAPGAVAAPTAGLHFDTALFAALAERAIRHVFVTLHVGAGTFQPMRVDEVDQHVMHEEHLEVPQGACDAINAARAAGGRVIAVGTTVVRSLETAAAAAAAAPAAAVDAGAVAGRSRLEPYRGATRIFIKPGHKFRAVDAMLTNFHLPESTLLMLCAAFVGRELLLEAYAHAVAARYRFFSYGDAMFLTPAPGALCT
jgi:S-adenosylmethionine:tRNA ribosyltransferase-isomerase